MLYYTFRAFLDVIGWLLRRVGSPAYAGSRPWLSALDLGGSIVRSQCGEHERR